MFKSTLDKTKLTKINQDLINGGRLKDVADKNQISYPHACYLRKKLVKAGALSPLYAATKRKTRSVKRTRTVNPVTNSGGHTFTLIVNGTSMSIQNVKSIYVSPDVVDIKY